MFPIFDNIFNRRRERLPEAEAFRMRATAPLAAPAVVAAAVLMVTVAASMAAAAILAACSAAPVKMECKEIQMRIDYGDLTADQLRFAMQELDECNGKARAAERKDSAFMEGAERRFTPADSLPAPSPTPADSAVP